MENNDPIPNYLIANRQGIVKSASEINFLCPSHDDHNPSANYNTEKKAWNCFACGDNGGFVDLQKKLGIYEVPQHKGETWEIRDISNKLITTKYRSDNGTGKKYWYEPKGIKSKELPLYNTEKIPTYSKDEPLFIVEGEKCAESLTKHGFQALGTITGASSIPNSEVFEPVLDFSEIFLLPDNDNAGYQHMTSIKQYLPQSNIYKWIDKPDKYDIADFIAESNNPDNAIKNLVSEFYSSYTPNNVVPSSVPFKELGTTLYEDYEKNENFNMATAKDLLSYEPPEIEWVWEKVLAVKTTNLLISEPKIGKTQTVLGLALAVSTGNDFLGIKTNKSKVSVYSFEDDFQFLLERIRKMGLREDNENFKIRIETTVPRLEQDDTMDKWLERSIKQDKPKLVILDTLFTMFPNASESINDYKIQNIPHLLNAIAKRNSCSILITHHANKNISFNQSSISGNNSLAGATTTNLGMRRNNSNQIEFKTLGNRIGTSIDSIVIKLQDNGFPVSAGKTSDFIFENLKEQIVKIFTENKNEEINYSNLVNAIEGKKENIDKAFNRMIHSNELEKRKEGKFRFYKLRDISESPWGS